MWILPVIVVAQFAGTSLWFSANAVLADLGSRWVVDPGALGSVTAAVQFGFIAGTLMFAVFGIADRFPARWVFCCCALAGALLNLWVMLGSGGTGALMALRAATGICLAGIYPVGMKIASGWYRRGLGRALGWLIGALVLGTAAPHLVRALGAALPWESVLGITSAAAAAGGLLLLFLVPDGPHLPPPAPFKPRALLAVFTSPPLRSAALGYFGHMWELYTLWAFVPMSLTAYSALHPGAISNLSGWSFAVVAAGTLGCIGGGTVSQKTDSARIAAVFLAASGLCCLLSPLLFQAPPALFLAAMLLWGAAVVGDSPQFSTVIARSASPALVGSTLTIVNSIGFAITIPSMLLLEWASRQIPVPYLFLLLAPGPLIGLAGIVRGSS